MKSYTTKTIQRLHHPKQKESQSLHLEHAAKNRTQTPFQHLHSTSPKIRTQAKTYHQIFNQKTATKKRTNKKILARIAHPFSVRAGRWRGQTLHSSGSLYGVLTSSFSSFITARVKWLRTQPQHRSLYYLLLSFFFFPKTISRVEILLTRWSVQSGSPCADEIAAAKVRRTKSGRNTARREALFLSSLKSI